MMPDENSAGPSYVNPSGVRPGFFDGSLGGAYSVLTTVHDESVCAAARYGCGSEGVDVVRVAARPRSLSPP